MNFIFRLVADLMYMLRTSKGDDRQSCQMKTAALKAPFFGRSDVFSSKTCTYPVQQVLHSSFAIHSHAKRTQELQNTSSRFSVTNESKCPY